MNLLLTSSGLKNKKIRDFFIETAGDIKDKRIGMVTSSQSPGGQKYIDDSIAEVEELGMIPYEVNISTNNFFDDLFEIDLWYVCGGNTYHIWKNIQRTGLDQILLRDIQIGKYYIGVSAGSIISSQDIIAAGWGNDGDVQEDQGMLTTGLGIVDFYILPHYNKVRHQEDVETLFEKTKQTVIGLTDEQAVYVTEQEKN